MHAPPPGSPAVPAPGPDPATGPPALFPLSLAQERLWLLDQLDPDATAYNFPIAVRWSGPLDGPALARAVNLVIARQESLRTRFPGTDAGPVQAVDARLSVDPDLVDLRDTPAAQRVATARRLAALRAAAPFDLAKGPLVTATLLRLASDDHVFLVVLPHIITDGWSRSVFLADLAAYYAGCVTGQPVQLPELTVQYGDYAAWQRDRFGPDRQAEALRFWTGELSGTVPLGLVPARDRPRAAGNRGGRIVVPVEPELVAALKDLGRRHRATLYMTLLATFQVLLYRYTGQPDVAVGSPIADRELPELRPLIGFFVNTVVLRADLADGPTFGQLLDRTRAACLRAFEHPELPFESLVSALGIARGAGGNPLFQAMFALQDMPAEDPPLTGTTAAGFDLGPPPALVDLHLECAPAGDGLTAQFLHHADLLPAELIAQLAGHWHTLLRAVVRGPDTPVDQLELLDAAGRTAALYRWNSAVEAPVAGSVLLWFERQVAATPRACAVRAHGVPHSYAELDARANQIAHRLRELGAGPETVVGVRVEPGLDLVAALLGVLKAGAAYLPLEPGLPAERVAEMVAGSGTRLVLCHRHLPPVPAGPAGADHPSGPMPVHLDGPDLDRQPTTAAPDPAAPDNLAYLCYTSGTTGRPKGVAVTRRALAERVAWMREHYQLGPEDRVLQFAALGFDTHVEEIFPTLCAGATLVTLSRAQAVALPDFLAGPEGRALTVLDLPTPYWHELVLQLPAHRQGWPAALRLLILGADQADAAAVAAFREATGGRVRVVNSYGPTETTVIATAIELDERSTGDHPPIGHPLTNTRGYLLDPMMNPVPVGAVGELWLGGAGLARGYVGAPGHTARRFRPDPYGPPGARLYRTGDRGRYRPDGAIEFLGRVDDQVKIRGYRIEPAGVDARLAAHPQVSRSITVLREDRPGDWQLVTYLVAARGATVDPAGLRAYLAESLPGYHLPRAIVALDRLPLTPSGKLDRAALPAPRETTAPDPATDGGPPPAGTTAVVAQVFAEVLGRERVAADADFFTLGGHSLLAVRVVARLGAHTGRPLGMRALFDHATPAALARYLESRGGAAEPADRPVRRAPGTDQVPLTPAQQRLYFLDRWEPGGAAYNIPVALRLRGALDPDRLGTALAEVVARHESLRTTFVSRDGQPVQVIAAHATVPLDRVDLTGRPAAEREPLARELVAARSNAPFDLAAGPLLRVALLRLAAEEHILCLVVHHIVADGWSVNVLLRDLSAWYAALGTDQAPTLPPLPIQFPDLAAFRDSPAGRARAGRDLSYWRAHLHGAPALRLPTDGPAQRPGPAGAYLAHRLDAALTGRLHARARAEQVTLFMVLLAAYQIVLAATAGQAEVCVGVPVAQRDRPELEAMVGLLLETLVLRGDLTGDPDLRGYLRRVRDTVTEAYDHPELPLEQLSGDAGRGREPGHSPLVATLFTLQDPAPAGTVFPGLAAGTVPTGFGQAKFDLTVEVWPEPELLTVFGYRTAVFRERTVRGLAERFEVVLRAFAEDPEARLSRFGVPVVAARVAAVPAPTPSPHAPRTSPASAAEELVASVWAEVLGPRAFDVTDDFFALGGHSLLAIKVVARLGAATGLEIPLRAVFDHSSLAALAGYTETLLLAEITALTDAEAQARLTDLGEGPADAPTG